jgi:hypothetical protein
MKTRVEIKKTKVELLPHKRKVHSAASFLKLAQKHPEKIEDVKFITPKLGSRNLGKFLVEYEW